MSTFKIKENPEYSKDLFGGYYQKNLDILKNETTSNQQNQPYSSSRFSSLKSRISDSDRSSDDINSPSNLNSTPNRRTPTHKQAFDLSFDSPNPSLAAINQKTSNDQSQQQQQPLWFNNPKRRTIPSQVIKRENVDDIEADSSFLTKTKSITDSNPAGFKTLSFGTRRNNQELAHVNVFSDELPPTRTISDLQKDDSSDAYLENTNPNISLISQNKLGGIESNNGTPFQLRSANSQNFLPDHLFRSSSSTFSTPIKTPDSPKLTTPLIASGESAVLVFGYPESIANDIIKHFAKFGSILEDFESTRVDPLFSKQQTRNFPIYTGNGWVKLTYDSRASAIRALEESGSILHGAMIFCVPYSKKAVESIGSIKVNDDIVESDIPLQQSNGSHEDHNILDYSNKQIKQKISLKNDDKIFAKSNDKKKALYSHNTSTTNGTTEKLENDGILKRVNNWLFGWDDL